MIIDTGIQYIEGKKNIVAYALSLWTKNGNQKIKQESNYPTETMSKINDTEELSKVSFI